MSEKRKNRRLPLILPVSYQKIDRSDERFLTGQTVNISTGGLFFETDPTEIEQGEFLNIELSIPPTEGLLEFGGRLSSMAKVLRICRPHQGRDGHSQPASHSHKCQIALQFCQPLKFWG